MPAVPTSAMIGAIVTFLGNKLANNESVNSFFDDFSEATVNWIKPLFIEEDDTPTRSFEKFTANPSSESKQKLLQVTLESELEDNPEAEAYIREMYEKISQTEEGKIIISNSKNVNTGNVNTGGGDFHLGDGNISKTIHK